jgi:hypothetical protein
MSPTLKNKRFTISFFLLDHRVHDLLTHISNKIDNETDNRMINRGRDDEFSHAKSVNIFG